MPEVRFSSNAEEIRHYIKEFLQDGALHNIEEMRSYVEQHSPNSAGFTTGMYTGALRDLVRNSGGRYANPVRGRYQLVQQTAAESAGSELRQKVLAVIDNACNSLSEACTVNIIGLSQSELAIASKVAVVLQQLKAAAEEIRQE